MSIRRAEASGKPFNVKTHGKKPNPPKSGKDKRLGLVTKTERLRVFRDDRGPSSIESSMVISVMETSEDRYASMCRGCRKVFVKTSSGEELKRGKLLRTKPSRESGC